MSPQVNQDYTPKIMQCTLAGQITDESGKGVEGVTVQGSKDAGTATTDATGKFSLKVNYAWTGELTFQKEGYSFNPPVKSMNSGRRGRQQSGDRRQGHHADHRGPHRRWR